MILFSLLMSCRAARSGLTVDTKEEGQETINAFGNSLQKMENIGLLRNFK